LQELVFSIQQKPRKKHNKYKISGLLKQISHYIYRESVCVVLIMSFEEKGQHSTKSVNNLKNEYSVPQVPPHTQNVNMHDLFVIFKIGPNISQITAVMIAQVCCTPSTEMRDINMSFN